MQTPTNTSTDKLIRPGVLNKSLRSLIRDAVNSAGKESASEWLVSEGYASDIDHGRELAGAAFYA